MISKTYEHIKFLNHSSMILNSKKTKILCDPWFKGSSFNNGWSLLYDESHDINQIDFDYIWISHEHPDHFSISTLSELKDSKTFLFQNTKDKKVKKFLEKKGHKVIELTNKKITKICDLELTCIVCDGYDSSLLVKFDDGTSILNINDARVEMNNHIENEILPLIKDDKLDLLAFQFSYANWAGNEDDKKIPKYLQQMTDEKNNYAINILKPKAIMPFASFVYFSHRENFFWNSNNWLNHVFKKFKNNSSILILPYPNQIISLNNLSKSNFNKQNKVALDFWFQKHEQIIPKFDTNHVNLSKIRDNYFDFYNKITSKNNILKNINQNSNFFLEIKITDLNLYLKVGLANPYFETFENIDNCSLEVSSETICFLFNQLFARGTISINGRVKFNYDNAHKFFLFFFIPYANNIGIYFNNFTRLTKEMLLSIANTSVMQSIIKFNLKTKKNMINDIDNFLSILDNANNKNNLFDIFNEEPQNDDLVE